MANQTYSDSSKGKIQVWIAFVRHVSFPLDHSQKNDHSILDYIKENLFQRFRRFYMWYYSDYKGNAIGF